MFDLPLEERVLPRVLAARASARPEAPFIVFRDRVYTYAETELLSTQLAHGLRGWGVTRDSRVALMLENSPEYILTLLALSKLGALSVPINTAARGELLRYFVTDVESTHVIVEDEHRGVLEEAMRSAGPVPTAVLAAPEARDAPGLGWRDLLAAGHRDRERPLGVELFGWDPWLILYTSGTTGPSKGSVCPNAHSLSIARTQSRRMELGLADRLYTFLPLFHGNALNYATLTALWAGASIALETRFSASRFWPDVHRYGATHFNAMMIVISILEKLPPTPEERDNPLRLAVMVPPPPNRRELEARWGLRIVSQYALSEACPVAVLGPGEAYDKPRSSGRIVDDLEVRIVDEHDREVPTGTAGEIVLRPRRPWTIFSGYYGKPEATARAFRNLWFHTGDRAYLDEDGYLFFVDRAKDAIRRRGENISAYEIETILRGHPGITEAAAVPVPSEMGEDEVAVYVVRADSRLTEKDVVDYAVREMAYFMVPRFVRFVDELPMTPSQKVVKAPLREWAKATYKEMWDREAVGIRVTRFTARERMPPATDRDDAQRKTRT